MTQPIFIFITRSFWLTLGAMAFIAGQGEPMARAIAALVAPLFGWDADVVAQWIVDIGPLLMLPLALQQRDGARPWTLRANGETLR
ncbi:hypothetical protein [Actibacterium sp. MT2.3-13A]|uniref:hypothetical protein n=1 Tax=Actibacterium sp. MT2.3-13A TaxID=2828332 RepID=UPI001BACC31C|nr:hypothetical protein [Actibacterium sp. MT2.3-13A]